MEALNLMDHPIRNSSDKYTVEEVSQMETHAELIAGELVITDKTTVAHNNAVGEIASALRQFIASNNGKCKVFTENVALYCNELCDDVENLFLPDVMLVCDESGIKNDGVHIAPDFIAEITSESTKGNDYTNKMVIYRNIGVKEYWVVDLQRGVIVRYLPENEFGPEMFTYPNIKKMSLQVRPLEIDLSRIFE